VLLTLIPLALVSYDVYFQWSTATLDFVVDEESGRVLHVSQHSFADWAGLWEGDVILSVEGVPFADWHNRTPGNYRAKVQRGDRRLDMELYFVPLVKVNRWPLISGVVTALVFWSVGTVLLWRRFHRLDVRILFLLMQVLAVAGLFLLAHPEGTRMPWMTHLARACFQLAAPLMLHHALTFPVLWGSPRDRRRVLALAYALTLAAIAATWLLEGVWVRVALIVTALELLVVGALPVYVYVRHASPDDRRRLRLILFGNLAAGIPTITIYVLPYILHRTWRPPSWTAGFFMVLAPFGYLLAIARHRLFEIDRLLNRALVYVLLSLGILLLYLGPFLLLYRFLPDDVAAQILVVSVLTLLVGLGFDWARNRARRLVDRLFYGGWYDYPGVVETVSDALARSLDREQLTDVLTRQVPDTMHLRHADLRIGGADCAPETSQPPTSALRLPLRFQGQVRGLWTVGPRRDGDDLTADDRRILQTLARQAEIALSNVLLVEALRRQLSEIRETQHQLLRSREEERARLARDLHDGPVQLLIGLNMQLGLLLVSSGEGRSPLTAELTAIRGEVRRLLADLRQVCVELRPPMLDTLGLGAALRALVEDWRAQNGADVALDLPPNADLRPLSDEVAVNLYRVVQEALINVARHAEAGQVAIRLTKGPSGLRLTVQDDGRGFDMPADLYGLTDQGHFGLAGMQERVDLIGGRLTVESAPGHGTTLRVVRPE
jgi:signal transduction histidine kinase